MLKVERLQAQARHSRNPPCCRADSPAWVTFSKTGSRRPRESQLWRAGGTSAGIVPGLHHLQGSSGEAELGPLLPLCEDDFLVSFFLLLGAWEKQ